LTLFLKPIELAINTALSQDQETKAKLDQFEQRSIALNINDFNHIITLSVEQQKLHLSSSTAKADLTISANAFDLMQLAHNPDTLFSPNIDINGDVQFAKQLQDLLEGFDFDWEAQLAKVTGDTLAYPLAHGIRLASSWLKNTHDSVQNNTAEYLKEELRILPDKSQIKRYMTEVDTLRADFDRLEARLNRL